MCGSRYILDSNAPLGARALDLGEVYPQLFGPLPGCHRGIGLTYTLGYLTGHLSRGVLHALRGLSGLVTPVLWRLVLDQLLLPRRPALGRPSHLRRPVLPARLGPRPPALAGPPRLRCLPLPGLGPPGRARSRSLCRSRPAPGSAPALPPGTPGAAPLGSPAGSGRAGACS